MEDQKDDSTSNEKQHGLETKKSNKNSSYSNKLMFKVFSNWINMKTIILI